LENNALLYGLEGKYGKALLAAAAMLPILGWLAVAAKRFLPVLKNVAKAEKVAKTPWNSSIRKKAWEKKKFDKVPKRKVKVKNRKTGEEKVIEETMELHHKKPRREGGGNDDRNLQPVWPTEHRDIDPHRRVNYDVMKVIGFNDKSLIPKKNFEYFNIFIINSFGVEYNWERDYVVQQEKCYSNARKALSTLSRKANRKDNALDG
jgi:hypothetical protein